MITTPHHYLSPSQMRILHDVSSGVVCIVLQEETEFQVSGTEN